MRTREINARKYEEVSNVAEVIFSYEGTGTDKEIVKALDKKYDALMDKLVLDALKNQLGKTSHTIIFSTEFMKNSIFINFLLVLRVKLLYSGDSGGATEGDWETSPPTSRHDQYSKSSKFDKKMLGLG